MKVDICMYVIWYGSKRRALLKLRILHWKCNLKRNLYTSSTQKWRERYYAFFSCPYGRHGLSMDHPFSLYFLRVWLCQSLHYCERTWKKSGNGWIGELETLLESTYSVSSKHTCFYSCWKLILCTCNMYKYFTRYPPTVIICNSAYKKILERQGNLFSTKCMKIYKYLLYKEKAICRNVFLSFHKRVTN